MSNLDRIVEYTFTAVLVVVTAILVWRHQNKPEPNDRTEKTPRER